VKLILTSEEAQIIEISLKGDKCDRERLSIMRPFLVSLGVSMLDDRDIEVDLTDKDLWFLRDYIDPCASVGNISGIDVIKKIYDVLLEHRKVDNYEVVEEGKYPLEVVYANKNNSKGKAKRKSKSRPRQKVESEATLPRPEKTDS